MKMRPATTMQGVYLNRAVESLRRARSCLAGADCPRTLAKVRSALKSAEGAQRHMERRLTHS